MLWPLVTLPIVPVKSKLGSQVNANQSGPEFWGNLGVCKETPRPGCESWLTLALGWAARGGIVTKKELPARRATQKDLSGCCTAAWGNELTVKGQGSPARDTFSLAEATNIVYTEPGLEKEGGKALT